MYTDEQKKRIAGMVEAFKGCKAEFASNPRYGLCYALSDWLARADQVQAYEDANKLVTRALDGHVWLESWLHETQGIEIHTVDMAALRLRWVDQLIADCEAALKD